MKEVAVVIAEQSIDAIVDVGIVDEGAVVVCLPSQRDCESSGSAAGSKTLVFGLFRQQLFLSDGGYVDVMMMSET